MVYSNVPFQKPYGNQMQCKINQHTPPALFKKFCCEINILFDMIVKNICTKMGYRLQMAIVNVHMQSHFWVKNHVNRWQRKSNKAMLLC